MHHHKYSLPSHFKPPLRCNNFLHSSQSLLWRDNLSVHPSTLTERHSTQATKSRPTVRDAADIDLLITEESSAIPVVPAYIGTPFWKRSLDFLGSIALLIALSPVLFAIALYIKLVSRGPVLFTQSRAGAGGEYFTIFKFRTMHQDKEAERKHREYVESLTNSDSQAEKPNYENRLIPGGEFLRSHSFDELPQLLNVLIGNMSLVGPRPEVIDLEDYPTWQLRRFEVLPGMSGLWQVSGKNRLSFKQMVELDIQYIEKRSLWLDLKILWRTIAVVVLSENE